MSVRIVSAIAIAATGILVAAAVCFLMLIALNGFPEQFATGPLILFGVGSLVFTSAAAAFGYFIAARMTGKGFGAFASASAAIVPMLILLTIGEFVLFFGGIFWADAARKAKMGRPPAEFKHD